MLKRLRIREASLVAVAILASALASFFALPFAVSATIEALALVTAIAVLAKHRGNENEPQPAAGIGSAVAGAIGSLISVRGWFYASPAFSHDWKWPLDARELHDLPAVLSSTWLPWGSGAPAIQALGTYPITLAGWALGFVFPPHLALIALFAILGAIAGYAIGVLASWSGLPRAFQLACALAYAAMPAWFNRECAGHLGWLLGYALFPLALAVSSAPMRERRRAASFAAVLGIAGAQFQFFSFFLVCALPLAVRRHLKAIAAGTGIAALLQLPAFAAVASAVAQSTYASEHANLTWQASQSEPLYLALISAADPAHYFSQLQNGASFFLTLPLLLAAALGATFNRVTRALGIMWICASVWAAGLDGPLRAVFAWTFVHVPSAVAFREFAHAEVIVATALLVLAAFGIVTIARRTSNIAGAAALILVALPVLAPALSGAAARIARPVVQTQARADVIRAIAALPGNGQILWWPGLQPVAYGDTRGGVDSDAFVVGNHAPYSEYLPTPALVQTLDATASGDPASCTLLAHLGIQAIVLREGIVDEFLDPQTARRLEHPVLRSLEKAGTFGPYALYSVRCYRSQRAAFAYRSLFGDWHDVVALARRSTGDVVTAPPPPPAGMGVFSPSPSYRSDDPAQDWVPLSAAPQFYDAFSSAFDDVIITSRITAVIPGEMNLAAAARSPYRWLNASQVRMLLLRGPVAIWLAADRKHAVTAATSLSPTFVEAGRYSYPDESSRRNLPRNAERVVVDGYATGWAGVPSGDVSDRTRESGSLWPLLTLWVGPAFGCLLCLLLVLSSKTERGNS